MTGVGARHLVVEHQGMGLVNLATTFDTTPRILVDQTQVFSRDGRHVHRDGTIGSRSVPFRVVLAWTDPPARRAATRSSTTSTSRSRSTARSYRGNVFSGASSTTGGTADIRNNLESVFLPAGTTGTLQHHRPRDEHRRRRRPGQRRHDGPGLRARRLQHVGRLQRQRDRGQPRHRNGTSQDCDANGSRTNASPTATATATIDACDGCPSDPLKIAPGQCGCGVPDTDTDGDGTRTATTDVRTIR
jgi:hypothetical protein